MKKILAALLVGLAATSFGIVNVNWNSTYGFYIDTGSGDPGYGILADGSGASALAQLVYCGANGVRDGVNIGGATVGDDVVWASYLITEDGIVDNESTFDTYAYFYEGVQNYQQALTTGNVYARIFQTSAVTGGSWYYYTPVLALTDITGTAFPQEIDLAPTGFIAINGNGTSMDPTQNSGLTGSAQVVPEPATFLLLGVGGVISMILRRMRSF